MPAMRQAFGGWFDVPDGYLNTANIGVPPAAAADAVVESVQRWRCGIGRVEDFAEPVATARRAFARLIGVDAERVAIGASVAQLVALVASSLPDRARVLVAAGEFTSVTFPFAAQQDRGVRVTEVPLEELPERAGGHDVVAVSAVQSGSGRLVDLSALREAAERHHVRVLLDVTQAAGWLPLELSWADWVVCASYKWLLAPRGAAWLAVRPDAPLRPVVANWFAGEEPMDTIYGLPLSLAGSARRYDLSPVWFSHVGAAVSMEWLAGQDIAEISRHCVGLADEFRTALGMPPAGSAIVSVDRPDAVTNLTKAGIACSARAGRARLSFHLYNTRDDVARAVRALGGTLT